MRLVAAEDVKIGNAGQQVVVKRILDDGIVNDRGKNQNTEILLHQAVPPVDLCVHLAGGCIVFIVGFQADGTLGEVAAFVHARLRNQEPDLHRVLLGSEGQPARQGWNPVLLGRALSPAVRAVPAAGGAVFSPQPTNRSAVSRQRDRSATPNLFFFMLRLPSGSKKYF